MKTDPECGAVDSAALWTAYRCPQGLDNASRCPHCPQPRRRGLPAPKPLPEDHNKHSLKWYSFWGERPIPTNLELVERKDGTQDFQNEENIPMVGAIARILDTGPTQQVVNRDIDLKAERDQLFAGGTLIRDHMEVISTFSAKRTPIPAPTAIAIVM